MAAKSSTPASSWKITGNDRRHRKMVTVTLAPETVKILDQLRGKRSRGKTIDQWAELALDHAAKEFRD